MLTHSILLPRRALQDHGRSRRSQMTEMVIITLALQKGASVCTATTFYLFELNATPSTPAQDHGRGSSSGRQRLQGHNAQHDSGRTFRKSSLDRHRKTAAHDASGLLPIPTAPGAPSRTVNMLCQAARGVNQRRGWGVAGPAALSRCGVGLVCIESLRRWTRLQGWPVGRQAISKRGPSL
jgi:hypothetical protein